MIEKAKVRKEIVSCELQIKEKLKEVESESKRLGEMFSATNETQKLWNNSTEKAVLTAKYQALREALFLVQDLRCSEFLDD